MDLLTVAKAFAHPGADPRQWVSYGTVELETPDAPSTEFTPEHGPLVNVTLHPSGVSVRCRVAMQVAGNGEAEYTPFIQGDEVIVLIPEGDERAGPCIIGRLCNEIDAFPTDAAGSDTSKNTFSFTRRRTPYIFESSEGIVLRNATTAASMTIGKDGSIVLTDGSKAFVHIGADFVGMQTGDGKILFQIGELSGTKVVKADVDGKNTFELGDATVLVTSGQLTLGAGGIPATGNVATVQGYVNFHDAWCQAMAAAITLLGGVLAPLAAVFSTGGPGASPTIAAALLTVPANTIATYTPAITAALAAKTPDPSGNLPNMGCPGILAG